MNDDAETKAAMTLRLAVVNEMRSRRSELEPFIPGILEGTTSWEQYLEDMSHPAAWGGEAEMVMAANIVRRPITVYQLTAMGLQPIVTYGDKFSGTTINLLWSGAHYDLLVQQKQKGPPELEDTTNIDH